MSLIEPLDIGRVIGGSFEAFVALGWPMLLLAALIVGLSHTAWVHLYEAVLRPRVGIGAISPLQTAGYTYAATFLLRVVEVIFKIPAIALLVARYQGQPVSLRSAMAGLPSLFLPVVTLSLLQFIGAVLGVILFIVPGILIYLSWAAAGPVLIVERVGILAAIRRSRDLTTGSRGRILLAVLLYTAIVLGVWTPELMVRHFIPGAYWPITIYAVAFQIFAALLATGFAAALYVELRRIREGQSAPGLAEVFA
ncbi:hypothetical protein HZF05_03620 [Sphingomonas sp. CGMCC 1.13654]|uniref:Glycerophosphoryl diester phosphodiesterase membrane domain-containing protein n=1 Tax=Sphingomonas chungangi TaxID=2683589 RepID=A0A838L432_9SPHN|nr:hypothetical protein [Sphingomonas chungangi]MBA2933179.1 hypothetical protein [Sphingomonas chungangi]MVW57851.1 hypothetical protein [Sphingomonas chungangi]